MGSESVLNNSEYCKYWAEKQTSKIKLLLV